MEAICGSVRNAVVYLRDKAAKEPNIPHCENLMFDTTKHGTVDQIEDMVEFAFTKATHFNGIDPLKIGYQPRYQNGLIHYIFVYSPPISRST